MKQDLKRAGSEKPCCNPASQAAIAVRQLSAPGVASPGVEHPRMSIRHVARVRTLGHRIAYCSLIGLLSMAPAGCQMLPDGAPFYRGNPYEGAKCDGEFSHGTSVIVLGQDREYARVLADGEVAYIYSKYLITMEEWDRIQAAREAAAKVMDQTTVVPIEEKQIGYIYSDE